VLQIHDILVWIRIRIRGSMPLNNRSGSGSCYFRHWPSRCQQYTNKKSFSAFTFWKYIYHFSKIKSQKEDQGFSYYFCLLIEGAGSGSKLGTIPLTIGSRSWRPKNIWIRRIRIRNTVWKPRTLRVGLDSASADIKGEYFCDDEKSFPCLEIRHFFLLILMTSLSDRRGAT
jgi:hypothetical protein